jgi:hypothetical protein
MSQIFERRLVACPYNLAQGYLADMIGPRVSSPGSLALTLPLPGAELIKEVVVTYGAAIDPMHFDQPWSVHWKPKAGPYPEFDGELTVRADETYASSLLELRGSYRPPGGVAGATFDAAVGNRIARATAQALLERLGTEMESRYARDEKSKAGAS